MKRILYTGIIAILTLSMTGCSGKIIATVKGIDITNEQFEKTLQIVSSTRNYMDSEYVEDMEKSLGKKYKKNLENTVLSFMIDNELLYQEAKDKKLIPSSEVINSKYEELEKIINSNPTYKKEIDKVGLNKEYLLKQISKDLAIEKNKNNFEEKINISEKDILDYYEKNKSKFKINEVEASHILISTLDKNKKQVKEDEKKKLKEKTENLLHKINNGESFEELANKYSDDKSAGKNGGKLGYFSKNEKNAEFTNEAFKLQKGQISKVVETSYGYHIIKVTDKKEILKNLNDSKDDIKKLILNEKYINHIEELNKNADIKR
ncbi:peptidylprolyl isomerase [Romboutsia maritimum]|uniref:peptidylprolyl isomerase n=1 Tax=Romboutsia maritimum TaxID=2020948 RepID=UPI001FB15EAD|nr:peptidylprolyl isomerase [Romboutsia maritimum]